MCSDTPDDDRFCSLSWYDRQLVENSRSGDGAGGPSTGGEEEEEGGEELAAVGTSSLSPPVRVYGSDGGVDVGFGVRARPAQASVMATLKARSELKWLIEVNHGIDRSGIF